jgi:3-methyl-2-oxobutanoate hydroxymethyltransferase
VTAQLRIPTIGIGAGVDCSGQVLVLHDMLDIYPGKKAKFVKNFLRGIGGIQGAIASYVKEVKARSYPGPEHSF